MAEISVHFMCAGQELFACPPDEEIDPNVITLGIQPDEGISVKFGAKKPAAQMQMARCSGILSPDCLWRGNTRGLNHLAGEATLFTRHISAVA